MQRFYNYYKKIIDIKIGYNSVALSFAFRFGLFFQYLLGFGLPDEENTTSNYWRFTLLFPAWLLSIFHKITFNLLIFSKN